MKTKFFKTGFPIMAFLMAIGLAFATERNTSVDDNQVIGYIHENGLCVEKQVNCSSVGVEFCTLIGSNVYLKKINSTTCDQRMYEWP